jgi:hypothetical protein
MEKFKKQDEGNGRDGEVGQYMTRDREKEREIRKVKTGGRDGLIDLWSYTSTEHKNESIQLLC